ncbi:MAG: sigma-70 region 4 domain-containing protein, partial [Bacteroidota bacterium]
IEAWHDMEKALARLPARTRAVIWLHDVEGFTHKEIGHLMGKTASYSKSQMARGYQRLLSANDAQRADGADNRDRLAGDAQQRETPPEQETTNERQSNTTTGMERSAAFPAAGAP